MLILLELDIFILIMWGTWGARNRALSIVGRAKGLMEAVVNGRFWLERDGLKHQVLALAAWARHEPFQVRLFNIMGRSK